MLRFAQQSMMSPSTFHNTRWIPMTARNDPEFERSPISSNSIASLLATIHSSTRVSYLPYISPERQSHLFESDIENLSPEELRAFYTLHQTDRISTIFMTVGGENHESISALEGYSIRSRDQINNILRKKRLSDQLAGDILGVVLNDFGQMIDAEVEEVNRRITFSVEKEKIRKLAEFNSVWVIAAMHYKMRAVYMALKNGYANSLVIDSVIADYLIGKAS